MCGLPVRQTALAFQLDLLKRESFFIGIERALDEIGVIMLHRGILRGS